MSSEGGNIRRSGSSQGENIRTSGSSQGESNSKMMKAQAGMEVAKEGVGLISEIGSWFGGGSNEKRMNAEKERHEEKVEKMEEQLRKEREERARQESARQEDFQEGISEQKRLQYEFERRQQEKKHQKEIERKNDEKEADRERELIRERIRAAEIKNAEIMANTNASLERDAENFLHTKRHMENTSQMERNMIKGLTSATAFLYKEMGYFNDPSEDNGNQNVRLKELEASPSDQQVGEAKKTPECFKCGSSSKMTFCSHFFCPNCHVNDGKVHCPVCEKTY